MLRKEDGDVHENSMARKFCSGSSCGDNGCGSHGNESSSNISDSSGNGSRSYGDVIISICISLTTAVAKAER